MDKRTTESILKNLKEIIETKQDLSPEQFIDAALFLEILIGDEHQELLKLQQIVSKIELEYLKESKSATEAKIKVKATDEYRLMREKEFKIKQIDEFVRIAKKQSEIRKI